MSIKSDLEQIIKPYYVFNILLSVSFVVLKRIPGVCNYLFQVDNCEFDGRETEILFFLLIVVMMRTRKAGTMSMISYISSSFLYTKVANLILWFNADFLMGIIYGIIFILGAIIFPEPTYSGPDSVLYFHGIQSLEEEINKDKDVHWLVTFYTMWNPGCINYAPIFARLSNEYALENLKFAKIDVGRYPDAGKKYYVNDGSLSKQLPTTVLFKEGKEVMRRPMIDSKGKITKFSFSPDNIKLAFDLNNLYRDCKNSVKNNSMKQRHIKKINLDKLMTK